MPLETSATPSVLNALNSTEASNYITSVKDSKVLEVTIKVNRKNIEPILQTFFRYDYSVKASFSEDDFELDMKNRYEGLMKYLNI